MFKKIFLGCLLAASLWSGEAVAQNPQCPDRPKGDSTNACANTRFVQQNGGGGGGSPTTILASTYVTCNNIADDTAGFISLTAAINAAVTAVVEFPANGTCRVWPNDTSATNNPILLNLTSTRDVTLNYNGASIHGLYTGAVSTTVIRVTGGTGLIVNDMNHTMDRGKQSGAGVWHVQPINSTGIVVNNGQITGGTIGIGAARASGVATGRSSNIQFNLKTTDVYYPISFQLDGDNASGYVNSNNAGRTYTPYGVMNHNIRIQSLNPTSNDVVLTCVGTDPADNERGDTTNIRVVYNNRLSTTVGTAIVLSQSQYGTVTATRTCKLDVDVTVDVALVDAGPFMTQESYVFVSPGVQALGTAAHQLNANFQGFLTGNVTSGRFMDIATTVGGFGNSNIVNFNFSGFAATAVTGATNFGNGTSTKIGMLDVYAPLSALTPDGTISAGNINGFNSVFSGANFSRTTQPLVILSNSATALTVGRQGATDPVLQVDAATASVVTGLKVTGSAAGSRTLVAGISSGTNEGLSIDAKGTGTIRLGATSTGAVEFSRNAVPTASDGAALGTTALMWSDIFLASGGVANFNNGNMTITHSTDLLAFAGSGASRQYTFASGTNTNGLVVSGTGTETGFGVQNSSAAGKTYNFNSTGTGSGGPFGTGAFEVFNATDGQRVLGITSARAFYINSATMIGTKTSFTNGAAAATGTLTNAPTAGNPTKWIPIDDNGTTRFIPAW